MFPLLAAVGGASTGGAVVLDKRSMKPSFLRSWRTCLSKSIDCTTRSIEGGPPVCVGTEIWEIARALEDEALLMGKLCLW